MDSVLFRPMLVATVVLWTSLACPLPAADKVFRAGVATIDITPTQPMPMWGYGDRHALFSRGTRDPLFAKALVIEAGAGKLAIVGLDLGRSPGEPQFSRILAAVKERSGIEHVLISGSHTHHGPVLELKNAPGQGQGKYQAAVDYVAELEKKLIEVINAAAANLQDARIGWTSRDVEMNRNRHWKQDPKPRDPELAVIRVDTAEGKPLAIVVNFAAHPVMLQGSDLRWSAEYPGKMARTVEQELATTCIFMQGAAGDMSPQTRDEDVLPADDARLADEALDAELTKTLQSVLRFNESDAKKLQREMIAADFRMESFGRHLGEEVLSLAKGCETKVPAKPSVKGVIDRYEFPSRVDFSNPAVVAMFGLAFFPELAAGAAAERTENKVRATLTTVLLNQELAMIGGSGEFFSNHAVRLKQRAYTTKTLFFGYCNGHDMYFPTIEAVSQGGYGADAEVSWVEVGAGERMMNQALTNVFTLQGKITRGPLAPPLPVDK